MSCGALSSRRKTARGFSLVELLVVLAIMGVLASVALPLSILSRHRTQEAELRSALREIRSALDAYKRAVDEGRIEQEPGASGYPPSLDALVNGVVDARSPSRERLFFLRRIPLDPFTEETSSPASDIAGATAGAGVASWGLRAYASPPDQPTTGRDVYDIYSRSQRVGLNGIPYREW